MEPEDLLSSLPLLFHPLFLYVEAPWAGQGGRKEGGVQIRGREMRGEQGEGMRVLWGEEELAEERELPATPAFPAAPSPRPGFPDHRLLTLWPCPLSLHGGSCSFLPWPPFIRSGSGLMILTVQSLRNYPGPGGCGSPHLDWQCHEGLKGGDRCGLI